jgi:hypothetical protein
VAVGDDLVAAPTERRDHLGAIVIEGGVDQRADRQLELLEELQAAPDADAVAVVAPCEVENVRLRRRRELRSQPAAELEVLDVEADVEREPLRARPGVVGPARDRRILVAAMGA